MRSPWTSLFLSTLPVLTPAFPTQPPAPVTASLNNAHISQSLFTSLEELARIVDISYCVGTSGIHHPFKCLSRCSDFDPGFELVTTWNTGPLLSDSSGYIALSHEPFEKRVIVAFRGTYSIANTIADLSTNPAEYAPFPGGTGEGDLCASGGGSDTGVDSNHGNMKETLLPQLLHQSPTKRHEEIPVSCPNCTVHSGFLTSWLNTRCTIVPHVERALHSHPDYRLVLVGHSLGGAVAALAALEFQSRGWDPQVTTFGEPRVGNLALNRFIDARFGLNGSAMGVQRVMGDDMKYRRVTHVDDPVPLLPLKEWGYRMHAGEIFISKPSLPPLRADVSYCTGDEDPSCIDNSASRPASTSAPSDDDDVDESDVEGDGTTAATGMVGEVQQIYDLSRRYKLWELFFAHRDYFWRLGLCVPGGDPWDWSRGKYGSQEPEPQL